MACCCTGAWLVTSLARNDGDSIWELLPFNAKTITRPANGTFIGASGLTGFS